MRETEYAYAVARIRANEVSLLTDSDMNQLISAEDYGSALRMLTGKGWAEPAGGDICEAEMNRAWELIKESVPKAELLEALVIGNDFVNLKAAIKTVFSGIETGDYFVYPSVCPPEKIGKAVRENDFSDLPPYLAETAYEAYHAVSGSQDGQSAEMIIDKAALETALKSAEKAESELLVKIASLACVTANIKIARRSAKTGKSEQFALDSMCDCGITDNEKLVAAAFAGKEIGPLISDAGFPEISEEADGDFSALEMKCDNLITRWIQDARYLVFGPDPVIAYYYAKTAETKNVRIILSAKSAGVPTEIIKQRVRDIYV